ncbi:MAG: glycosyltransferase family 2 protein, partial [Caldilineaceae bacterium]|nr:glycosyltransferase family 2 protein [Caldilineaceae bacterium]
VDREGINPLIRGPLTLEREIIIVDDGSTDGTRAILEEWRQAQPDDMRIVFHAQNGGKGAALRTGFQHATGDMLVIQDADLEYDPRDYLKLLVPVLEGRSPVVYGSRFMGGPRSAMSLSHTMGNKMLTVFTNILFGTSLSDMETCYKCFRRDVIVDMPLHSRRFEIEPEITAKILKRGYSIFEVPISYNGREFHEGKKITWRDGFSAISTLVKYRFVD